MLNARPRRKSRSFRKQYERGNITELERYNKVIDLWTHARDEITKQMMDDLQERPPRRARRT